VNTPTPTPTPTPTDEQGTLPAMALRDWFAGQALVGLIPAPKQAGVPALNVEGMARAAYEYADAMLKRRQA